MTIRLEESWDILKTAAQLTPSEEISLSEGLGRILTAPLIAQRAHPHEDIAAMDGYGFAATTEPTTLTLIGTAAAGNPFSSKVREGQCVRILTGAGIPNGVTSVAMQEDCICKGAEIIVPSSPAGQFIRQRGGDFREATIVCHPHQPLNARDIALGLAAGHAKITVQRRPRVRLLATGSELSQPGSTTGTINSNLPALAALLESAGAHILSTATCPDDPAQLQKAFQQAADCDLLLSCGGVSVGDKDFVRPCLELLEATILFHGVLMKPGKPSLCARLGKTLVLGLPGNPVSALVCGTLLALPLLRAIGGVQSPYPVFKTAILADSLPTGKMREQFLRGICTTDDNGMLRVKLCANQDSAGLHSLAEANCLLRLPINALAKTIGERISITMLH